jgi:hypothetical protein
MEVAFIADAFVLESGAGRHWREDAGEGMLCLH